MASPQDSVSMALFCDFENVALGVRDAKFEKFDIKPVLERLLLKGSIVVKKAYCDWDRYKGFKASMHEASFELIEIPHVRQSGKNSADIRLVVDALDLCYTKSHVDTFVIISGDSDFSPLVSKLRENAKKVIGVGVKNSTSDLLVANCDEFIFYDDLVREQQRANAKREAREASVAAKRVADEDKQPKAEMESRKAKAIAIAVETFDALASERGESGKIWASVLKSAIKRRKPDFTESYYGFRAFGNLLDEAQARGLLEVGRDDKSGAFVYRPSQSATPETPRQAAAEAAAPELGAPAEPAGNKGRKKSKGARKQGREHAPATPSIAVQEAAPEAWWEEPEEPLETPSPEAELPVEVAEPAPAKPRRARKTAAKKAARTDAGTAAGTGAQASEPQAPSQPQASASVPASEAPAKPKPARAPRKSAQRTSRPRKIADENNGGH
ncbi:NYN domain-containing protein [Trinickia sp.]|uniref:NYN domain-containing protein n=1 Tax=Trinickia sp. TaxID=2571163 RepID=UPI003F813226